MCWTNCEAVTHIRRMVMYICVVVAKLGFGNVFIVILIDCTSSNGTSQVFFLHAAKNCIKNVRTEPRQRVGSPIVAFLWVSKKPWVKKNSRSVLGPMKKSWDGSFGDVPSGYRPCLPKNISHSVKISKNLEFYKTINVVFFPIFAYIKFGPALKIR